MCYILSCSLIMFCFLREKMGIVSVVFRFKKNKNSTKFSTFWYSSRIFALFFFLSFFTRKKMGIASTVFFKYYSEFLPKICHSLPLISNKNSGFLKLIWNKSYTKVQDLDTSWSGSSLGVDNHYYLWTGSADAMILAFRSAPV